MVYFMRTFTKNLLTLIVLIEFSVVLAAGQATSIPTSSQLTPEDLVNRLKSSAPNPPLLFQVGSHVLYAQAHIPGSEYLGAASTPAGVDQLRKRVASVSKKQFIVLYCGCCPWTRCPNEKPAFDALQSLGFTNVKVLYIADNFGTDWVQKGYPTEKGD